MQWGASLNITICRPSDGLCAGRPMITTRFQLWSRPLFRAKSSRSIGCLSRLYRRPRFKNDVLAESVMYISKKRISRRTMLKGIGTTIALPLLDAMNPAAQAWAQTAAGSTPKRFAFVGFPHGAIMDRWVPKTAGTDYEMSPILEPLAPFRKHMTIISGLRNKPAESPEPHGYIEMTWLSCVKPAEHGVANPDAGVTTDQLI